LNWDSVRYECEQCGGHWTNDDKALFLEKGQWVPTADPVKPSFRSYHINALYSPLGMTSWEDMAFEFLRRKSNPSDLQTFINTYLGEPWEARHNAPQYERIMVRREGYDLGTLPKDAKPLLVTIGADVQKDRIEMEIVAWGNRKVSWSVDYRIFHGDTSNPDSDAWEGLRWTIESQHAGLPVSMALVDSGYNTPLVYRFCSQYYAGVAPVMGMAYNARVRSAFKRAPIQGHSGVERVDLYADQLKQELFGYLTPKKNDDDIDPDGYCHFPVQYKEDYFRQLTAEERVRETMRNGTERYVWRKIRERNEAHDCRIYAMGALYVYAADVCANLGQDQIDWQLFFNELLSN
jgi:phage terminase large subunit GpA-like protein